jgi:hypothetical protein
MAGDFRVMSFNIRNSHARDEDHNKWPNRKELVYEVIRKYAPDILGLQEVNRFQLDDIKQIFPEYENVGMGSKGNQMVSFLRFIIPRKDFQRKNPEIFGSRKHPRNCPRTGEVLTIVYVPGWLFLIRKLKRSSTPTIPIWMMVRGRHGKKVHN